jgi:5-methylcytosine-specific restriction enzyme subunit McrC
MRKPVEVREFESITYNRDFVGENGFTVVSKEDFEDLEQFIEEYTGAEGDSDAFDFMRISKRRSVGEVISFNNYVGLIQTKKGFQVQVLPKIDYDVEEDSGHEKTKKIFLGMLSSMKDFPGKTFNDASLNVGKMNLYELFIAMYIKEVQVLVKHGIRSYYVQKEDNLNCLKGKLLFSQHIKQNMAHKEKFYVCFDDFNMDTPENRIIKATLEKLLRITTSARNSKDIRQLLPSFEMIDASRNYEADLSLITINRNTKDYELLIKWAKIFLFNKSFTTFSGQERSRALLFPMESVYESYIAKQIKHVFGNEGWDVSAQDHSYHLFSEPKRFALRPDIVVKNDTATIVMDTKWKRLVDLDSKNYGISQADMYQMYAYSKYYNSPEIWLLYPMTNDMREHEEITYSTKDRTGISTRVNVFFIDLSVENIEDEIRRLHKEVAKKAAESR